MTFKLEDYEPVEERIKKFYKDNKEGRILTEIHADDGKVIIIKASIYRGLDEVVWATGYAEEVRGASYINKTSAVENCETSAIGRALANANYAGSKRPSREEMEKVDRQSEPTALDMAQVAKLMSLAKMKGAKDRDEAISFINGALLTQDFTKLDPSKFDEYKAVLSDPKVTIVPF